MPRLDEAKINLTRFAEACGVPDRELLDEICLESGLSAGELIAEANKMIKGSPERQLTLWAAARHFLELP